MRPGEFQSPTYSYCTLMSAGRCADLERMNLHRERRSGVIDRLHVVDQVRHRRLTGHETVPDNVRERLIEVFHSWNAPTRDHTVIPWTVRAEASALARELQARGLYITDQQLLINSVMEGWRIVKGKYSDSNLRTP